MRTYAPDNGPVHISIKGDVLVATEPVEPLTGLEKQITVKLAATGTHVEVLHRIRNTNKTAIELAPWALSMMAQGGVGIHGFPPRGTHPGSAGADESAGDVCVHAIFRTSAGSTPRNT